MRLGVLIAAVLTVLLSACTRSAPGTPELSAKHGCVGIIQPKGQPGTTASFHKIAGPGELLHCLLDESLGDRVQSGSGLPAA